MNKRQKDNDSVTPELTVLTTTGNADNPGIFFPENEQNWVQLSEEDRRLTGDSEKDWLLIKIVTINFFTLRSYLW